MAPITVRGKIIFQGGAPDTLPAGSTLLVSLDDTSLQDVACRNLSKMTIPLDKYSPSEDVRFELSIPSNKKLGPVTSISAVLNAGWTPRGDDWIREGDYCNDCSHRVPIRDGQLDYVKDVEVRKYT